MFGLIFLLTVGIAAVEERIDFEFFADSETYLEISHDSEETYERILLIQPNVIGPILILRAFNNSYLLVLLMNAFICSYFFHTVSKYYKLNRNSLLFYLLMSPLLFVSLVVINKEVLTLLPITLLFRYLKGNNFFYLLLAIASSFLVRWQMALFVVSVAIFMGRINVFRERKALSILIFLLCVSIVYFLNQSIFQHVNDVLAASKKTDNVSKSGLFYTLMDIQNESPIGYVLVFIVKGLHLFIGVLSRYSKFFDWREMYTNVFVFSQALMNVVVMYKVVKKRIKLSNIFLSSAIIYAIIFALSPIYSPRYLFPVYIMLTCAIATPKVRKPDVDTSTVVV